MKFFGYDYHYGSQMQVTRPKGQTKGKTMSHGILGSLMRALVTVPEHRLGLVQDFAKKLAGSDGEAWETQGKAFLRKEQSWSEPRSLTRLIANLESDPDIQAAIKAEEVIHVDRSIKPIYPDWIKEVLHPDLEKSGPTEYSIATIDQWLHEGQKNGKWTTGNVIYEHLKDNDEVALKTCLGLRDLEEIQKKGTEFFRKYFKGKAVFGWAGCVRDRNGNLIVPSLYENGIVVVLYWSRTDGIWYGYDPALRHTNSPQT